jgi:hypothetical protein
MKNARIGLVLLAIALLSGCRGRSSDFWKDAESTDVVRVAVLSSPPGTSGKGGGTIVAYATDISLEESIERYAEFFRARGVAPTSRETESAYFDDPKSGLCMTIGRWGQSIGLNRFAGTMSDADEARMTAARGAYWILVPDDCSYKG